MRKLAIEGVQVDAILLAEKDKRPIDSNQDKNRPPKKRNSKRRTEIKILHTKEEEEEG